VVAEIESCEDAGPDHSTFDFPLAIDSGQYSKEFGSLGSSTDSGSLGSSVDSSSLGSSADSGFWGSSTDSGFWGSSAVVAAPFAEDAVESEDGSGSVQGIA
jgi:hypothetical protein